jgi:hypothetical protein
MEDWEIRKESVREQLNLLEYQELETLCETLEITIPTSKAGKRSMVYTLVSRYIDQEDIEESADKGLAIFSGIDDQFKGHAVEKD